MNYIFKQKLKLSDLVVVERPVLKILIFEPEEYLGALYKQYLNNEGFDIYHALQIEQVHNHLKNYLPHLLVYNLDVDKGFKSGKIIFKNYPELKVITTGFNVAHEDIKGVMSHGVLSHINRRFSRPTDLVTLALTILKEKNS